MFGFYRWLGYHYRLRCVVHAGGMRAPTALSRG